MFVHFSLCTFYLLKIIKTELDTLIHKYTLDNLNQIQSLCLGPLPKSNKRII